MKALLYSGLALALGFAAVRVLAEDVPWRSAGPRPGAAIRIVDAPPPGEANRGFSLRHPVPLAQPNDNPAITPVNFRAADAVVFRAKADAPRPLPPGPGLPPLPMKPIPLDDQPLPKANGPESIPVAPTPILPPAGLGCCPCPGPEILTDCCDACCDGRRCGGRLLSRWREGGWGGCCDDGCSTDWGGGWDDGCPQRPRIWLSAEYLMWDIRGQRTEPLLTTSPSGTPSNIAGVLGNPAANTKILFDTDTMEDFTYNGGRFRLGFWCGCYNDLGLEVGYFFLGRRHSHFLAESNGDPILARPIIDANTGAETALLVAHPNVTHVQGVSPFRLPGSLAIDSSTALWGVEANLRYKLVCGCRWHFDVLYGIRHIQLDDTLVITDVENFPTSLGGPATVVDSFSTRNQFTGPQVGFDFERRLLRRWFFGCQFKLGFGVNHQVVNVAGATTFQTPAAGVINPVPAGILALGTNSGHHSRDSFSVVPELNLKFGIDLNDHWRFWVGYDFLMIPNVVRAGDQIDRTINRSQIPSNMNPPIGILTGTPRPVVPFRVQDFWAQGLNLGLEYRW